MFDGARDEKGQFCFRMEEKIADKMEDNKDL